MLIKRWRPDPATIRTAGRVTLWTAGVLSVQAVLVGVGWWLIWKVPTALYAYAGSDGPRQC